MKTTMKKIVLLAAGFLIGGAAFAQTSSVSPVRWGLKAGVSLPKYHINNNNGEDGESEANTNFHITGYADVPVSAAFSVQPGISLQGKGGKTSFSNGEWKDNSMYIEVPVNLVGKLPLGATGTNLYLGAGPYAAFAISGERELEGSIPGIEFEGKRDLEFGNDSGDDLKGIDFGVNFLGGVQLNNGINLGAGYGLGLTDLRPNSDSEDNSNGKVTNRVWTFSIGYSF